MKFKVDLKTHFLKPAEFCFVKKPSLIRTVLGSCVTITMFNKRTGVAAACHPVLPICLERDLCQPGICRMKNKYVDCVIPEMIRCFSEIGSRPDELEIKLFGGANMFSHVIAQESMNHIGNKNVSMAQLKLDEIGLEVKAYDVGGNYGRKLYFDTSSGDVWLKKFQNRTANQDEKKAIHDQIAIQLSEYGK